jgi:hypothetical protein
LPKRWDFSPSKIVNNLIFNRYLPGKTKHDFDMIRRINNKVAYTTEQITEDEIENYSLARRGFKNDLENIN